MVNSDLLELTVLTWCICICLTVCIGSLNCLWWSGLVEVVVYFLYLDRAALRIFSIAASSLESPWPLVCSFSELSFCFVWQRFRTSTGSEAWGGEVGTGWYFFTLLILARGFLSARWGCWGTLVGDHDIGGRHGFGRFFVLPKCVALSQFGGWRASSLSPVQCSIPVCIWLGATCRPWPIVLFAG